MVLKLYGLYTTHTHLVITVLKETNTPYVLVELDFFGGAHKAPAYLEKQPFGEIPYIDDDGVIVFESRAIARYIAAKARSPLLPSTADLDKYAAFETASSIEAFNFYPYASEIVEQLYFVPGRGGDTDDDVVAEQSEILESKLQGYERMLGKTKYLAGDEITIADLAHLPYGALLAPHGVTFLEDENKFPNVARWWKDISSRPSWQEVWKDT